LLCASAMTDSGEDVANFFCKQMGYPGIEADFYSVDTQFDFTKASSTTQYASSLMGLNQDDGTIQSVNIAANNCPPVQIKCKGLPDTPNHKAAAKNLTRHPAPPIKLIQNCSDSPSSLGDWIKGDPGSVYTFICPANCEAAGTL